MKTFTKLLFFAVFLLSLQAVQAESLRPNPRPYWVWEQPVPPEGANYIFICGEGTGKTETEAELGAWKNALYSAFNEGGLLNVTTQAITLNEAVSLDSLNFLLDANRLQRRRVCQTPPIPMLSGKIIVYVLLQVQRDATKSPDFYDYPIAIDCEPADFRKELEKWNEMIMKKKLEAEKKELEKKAEKNAFDEIRKAFDEIRKDMEKIEWTEDEKNEIKTIEDKIMEVESRIMFIRVKRGFRKIKEELEKKRGCTFKIKEE
ncbi:MAG: hypothetical protein LBQ28_03875 [Prevotellaceae bacterium]|jgi:hypothetical protein|nr:hypothetical protein [Prevotellaceae bacterium]